MKRHIAAFKPRARNMRAASVVDIDPISGGGKAVCQLIHNDLYAALARGDALVADDGYFKRFFIFHSAPVPLSTTATVLSTIFKSSHGLQLSMYSQSSRTTSSKSLIEERPLTCHIPVIPGRIERRRL